MRPAGRAISGWLGVAAAGAAMLAGCSGNDRGGGTGAAAGARGDSGFRAARSAAPAELTTAQGQALLAAIERDPNRLYHLSAAEKQFMRKAAAGAKMKRDEERRAGG